MEYYIGDIVLFAFNFAPMDFLPCDGRTLQTAQYQALLSLIGYQYGGNGTTTFALPDLRNASPLTGVSYFIATAGLYPPRS